MKPLVQLVCVGAVALLLLLQAAAQDNNMTLSNWPAAWKATGFVKIESLLIDSAAATFVYNNQVAPTGIAVSTASCPTARNQPCTVFYIASSIYIIDSNNACCRIPGQFNAWPATQGFVPIDWPTLTKFEGWEKIPNAPYDKYPEYLLESDPPVYYYPNPSVIPCAKAPPGVIMMHVPTLLGRSAQFTFTHGPQGTYLALTQQDFALFPWVLNKCGQLPAPCH